MNNPTAPAQPVDLAEQSVAGEEDPGASVDMASAPLEPERAGDEAPEGTPGTGEDVCRTCGGKGLLNGGACPDCNGTGKVTAGIGGG